MRWFLLFVVVCLAGCRSAEVRLNHVPSGLHVCAKVER